jgi:membrane associated rhomboid family serine protease
VFIPLSDDNPLRSIRWPWVTVALIVANVLIYGFEVTPQGQSVVASFAIIPSELFQVKIFGGAARGPFDALAFPEGLTLLSYMFLHGDPVHLLGNMLFLWVFGDNVEDAMGHLKFLAFYLVSGVVGGLVHAYSAEFGFAGMLFKFGALKAAGEAGKVPLIGASAAVAGVIAAYLLLHPRVRVWVLAFRFVPLRITAALALGAWILTQFTMLLIPNTGPIAWWAHIGGIIAGAVLILFMRRPGVPLFDRPPPEPQPTRPVA